MTDTDIDILARTLYGEAESGNFNDAAAIACVIRNRVNFRNWPNTYKGVCLQPWQFSCWNAGDPNRERILKATTADKWFVSCIDIANKAINSMLQDITQGSTHYYATYIQKPKWAKGHIPVYEVAHIQGSKHLFFNDIDTKPPKSAKEALDQKKPLSKTRTMKGAGIASAGVGLTAATEVVNELQSQIQPLVPYADTLKFVFLILALVGIGITVWARISDRKEGVR